MCFHNVFTVQVYTAFNSKLGKIWKLILLFFKFFYSILQHKSVFFQQKIFFKNQSIRNFLNYLLKFTLKPTLIANTLWLLQYTNKFSYNELKTKKLSVCEFVWCSLNFHISFVFEHLKNKFTVRIVLLLCMKVCVCVFYYRIFGIDMNWKPKYTMWMNCRYAMMFCTRLDGFRLW